MPWGALHCPSVIIDPAPVDVAIIGGGPAGAAAACLLAKWGHSVSVLTRPGASSSALGESLPPSTRKLLERIGFLSAVDEAGFVRSRGHTVWWGESQERVEEFSSDNTGYQVFRRDLDRVLLDEAIAEGARVQEGAVVKHVELDQNAHHVAFVKDDSPLDLRARWVLDCSGRSGVVARREYRRREEGRNTVALVGLWRRSEGWNVPDPTHTLVESFTDGWAWSVPVDDEQRYFTVMIDPRVTDMERGKDLASTYRSEMRKAKRLDAPLVRVGPALVRGTLHDLGDYPGLIAGGNGGEVRGVLFELPTHPPRAREVLGQIDAYEGFNPGRTEHSLFVRQRLRVHGVYAAELRLQVDGNPRVVALPDVTIDGSREEELGLPEL